MTRIFASIDDAIAHSTHTAVAPLAWQPGEHLLSRFSFGATEADRAWIARHGVSAWWKTQVTIARAHPIYAADPESSAIGPLVHESPTAVRRWLIRHGREYGQDAMHQLSQVTIGMQCHSPAQLYETLVDFFANHLNVANHYEGVWTTRHIYDSKVIRAHALGTFTDMLLASGRAPAMLIYLSLRESEKAHVNENYGREVLEMHTVGLRYSESDVKNSSAAFTGRTLDAEQNYAFQPSDHKTGPIRVLGFTHPNADARHGEAVGDALLTYLARHPYTASHLATKLCIRYVSDTPSATLVQAVARAYRDNDTAILPMISTILRSDEFWESRGQKVRRPAENVIATVRALGIRFTDPVKATSFLHWALHDLGNGPLDWPAPNGYPDVAEAWRSAGNLLSLWNLHLGLASGWWPGFSDPALDRMHTRPPRDSGDAIAQLTRYLTGRTYSAHHRSILQNFLDEPADTDLAHSKLRWEIKPLAALILDAPQFALR